MNCVTAVIIKFLEEGIFSQTIRVGEPTSDKKKNTDKSVVNRCRQADRGNQTSLAGQCFLIEEVIAHQ